MSTLAVTVARLWKNLISPAAGKGDALVGAQRDDLPSSLPSTIDIHVRRSVICPVRDFGLQDGGTVANSTAWTNSVAAAVSKGAILRIPYGFFRVTTPSAFSGQLYIEADPEAVILCDFANDYLFTGAGITDKARLHIEGLTAKWYGTFGTSTAGFLKLNNYAVATVEGVRSWGLGKEFVLSHGFNANLALRDNKINEHVTGSIVKLDAQAATQETYLAEIDNNFMQYTGVSTGLYHCIEVDAAHHLEVKHNALEQGLTGVYLGPFGAVDGLLIENNFIEACTKGVVAGPNNASGYMANIRSGEITRNKFTGTGGAAGEVYASCVDLHIHGNDYDPGYNWTIGKQSKGVRIGRGERYVDPSATAVSGFPSQIVGETGLDMDWRMLENCQATTGWSSSFNPSGTGAITQEAAGPFAKSIQFAVTGDQFIVQKTLAAAVDLTGYDYFLIPVYFAEYVGKVYGSDITDLVSAHTNVFRCETTAGNEYQWDIKNFSNGATQQWAKGEWVTMIVSKADMVASGTPNWNSITKIYVNCRAKTGQSASMRVGGVFAVKLRGLNPSGGVIDMRTRQAAIADTSGVALGALETEVNKLKASMRSAGVLLP